MKSGVVVLGEALIDVLRDENGNIKNIPGGSPANTAVALSKLGMNVQMRARTSSDDFGIEIRNHLQSQNVKLDQGKIVDNPSSVIDAYIQKDGSAKYEANLIGAADYGWQSDELAVDIDIDTKVVHLGSLTSYIEPGATNVENWFKQLSDSKNIILSFDPNIRHPLDGQNKKSVQQRALRLASYAHIVKASDEDLIWINPELDPEKNAQEILESGAIMVVVTKGKEGAVALLKNGVRVEVSAPKIEVIDTIGAGDTFAAALITQIIEKDFTNPQDLLQITEITLRQMLTNSAQAAAITCSRKGANPPLRQEVNW